MDFEDWWFDDYNQDVVCKFCGQHGFEWRETRHGWRLFSDTGVLHTCSQRSPPSTADEFEFVGSTPTRTWKGQKAQLQNLPRYGKIVCDESTGFNIMKKQKLPPYKTIGVRFIAGTNLAKIYTYRVRKSAKVHLGQELIADSPTGAALVIVVRIDKTPQDTEHYEYKFIDRKAAPL